MPHVNHYLASLFCEPKSSQESLALAVQVIPTTIDGLRATGVLPSTLALVLSMEIKKIAQEHDWCDDLKRQFIPPAFWNLLDETMLGDTP